MARYTDLPNELLIHIARHLSSWQDLAALSATDRRLNHVAGSVIMSNLVKAGLGSAYLSWSINGKRLSGVTNALNSKVDPNEGLRPTRTCSEPNTPQILTYKRAWGEVHTRVWPVYGREISTTQIVQTDTVTMAQAPPRQLREYIWKYRNGSVSALHLAVQRGNVAIIRILVEHGADLEALCNDDRGVPFVSPHPITSSTRRSPNGVYDEVLPRVRYTPLHCAILLSNVAAAKLLISAGASHRTCVPLGASRASSWLVPATPLHFAAYRGLLDLVEYIVDEHYQPDVNAVDEFGGTPLAYASLSGHMNSTGAYLLGKGGDPDTMISDDCNLLLDACWHGRFGDAALLLDYGAKPNGPGSLFTTVLHACCRRANSPPCVDPCDQEVRQESLRLDLIKRLLESGIEVDKCIFYPGLGNATALLLAADCGMASVVELLLSAGADPDAHNATRFSAHTSVLSSYCDEQTRFETACYLLDHGCDVNKPDP